METMEPGIVISGAEKEVVDVGANDELASDVVNMPGKSIVPALLIRF